MSACIIIGIIFLVIVICIRLSTYQKKKMLKRFRLDYVNWDNTNYNFDKLKVIREYWDAKNKNENIQYHIDDVTWNDLDMDYLYSKMNVCQSSVGEEYLYAKLRKMEFDQNTLDEFEKITTFMSSHRETKAKALCELYTLGKDLYNNVHSYIYKIECKQLENAYLFYFLMAVPILAIIGCLFSSYFFFLVMFSFVINGFVYYKYKFKLEVNLNSLTYISKLIYCAKKLSLLDFKELGIDEKIEDNLKSLKSLHQISSSFIQKGGTDLDFFIEYIKILFMWDFVNYNRVIRILSKYIKEFGQLYELIGELDSAIAIHEYRNHLDFYCKPEFTDTNNIEFAEIYHPLIDKPVSNSLDWNRNSLITGSNASGKSTFIKALAISGICAQTINVCFAKSYKMKMSFIITSMAVRDNIYQGESYFIAEIKSLKRIVDTLNSNIRCVCFIDEILRGTNTIERIASSAAILNWLCHENCLVMVASHDIELTEMLETCYENYHFKERITDDGLQFDYKIFTGNAKTKNAIKLLEYMGFNDDIIGKSKNLADHFESYKKWEVFIEN